MIFAIFPRLLFFCVIHKTEEYSHNFFVKICLLYLILYQ